MRAISLSVFFMIMLQGIRELAEFLIKPYIPDTRFAGQMLTMCIMMVLTAGIILLARKKKWPLSIFPQQFSKWYILATCAVVLLYVATPANYIGGLPAVLVLIYGSIITPVYEELIFRGLIWNSCKQTMKKEFTVYTWNVILFALWHFGYMIQNMINGQWNAVLWKVAAGIGYGIVLGFVRMKSKNCYACILVHGVLNLFMV